MRLTLRLKSTNQSRCEHGARLDEEGDEGADDDGEVPGEPGDVGDLRVQGPLHHLRHLKEHHLSLIFHYQELFGIQFSYLVLHERVEDLDEEDEAGGEDAERDDEQDEP